jgi:hypothetical protein
MYYFYVALWHVKVDILDQCKFSHHLIDNVVLLTMEV